MAGSTPIPWESIGCVDEPRCVPSGMLKAHRGETWALSWWLPLPAILAEPLLTTVASCPPGDVHPPARRRRFCWAGHCVRDVPLERPALLHHPRHCPRRGEQPGEEQIPCVWTSLRRLRSGWQLEAGRGCFPASVPGMSHNPGVGRRYLMPSCSTVAAFESSPAQRWRNLMLGMQEHAGLLRSAPA